MPRSGYKVAYIHIGTEKTGSSAIQAFIEDNLDLLRQNGATLPKCWGSSANHRHLPLIFYSQERDDDLSRLLRLPLGNDRQKIQRRWLDSFAFEVESSGCRTWIISCEYLHSRLKSEQELSAMADTLNSIFDKVFIIVYLREPLSAAISLWSEAIRAGQGLESLPCPSNAYWDNLCNHQRTVERWQTAFGQSAVIPRIFNKPMLHKRDIALDLLHCCGIEIGGECSRSSRYNESLSYPEMLALVYLFKNGAPGEAHSLVSQVAEARRMAFGPERLSGYIPLQSEVTTYETTYNASNQWISQNFFSGKQLFSGSNCLSPSEHMQCDREKWEATQFKASLEIMARLISLRTKRPALLRRVVDKLRSLFVMLSS